jgi:hypothetical protein
MSASAKPAWMSVLEKERNMSPETENDVAERRARMRAQNVYAGERGKYWRERHEEAFRLLPKGTIVVINCRTGEYVTAPDRLEADDAYVRRFGKNEIGYSFEIGGGIFVGGGLWRS